MTDVKMIRRLLRIRFSSLTVVRVVLCSLALQSAAIAQTHSDASANAAAQKLSQQKSSQTNAAPGARCKTPPPMPLQCPAPANVAAPSGPVAAQGPGATTNPRTVRLTWNANRATHNFETDAFGYCLYRSTQKISNPILGCKNCELVTKFPVTDPDLGCIDNVTQAGKIYFYVVAAINQCGVISSASNEAKAEIDKPSPKTDSERPLPSCRK